MLISHLKHLELNKLMLLRTSRYTSCLTIHKALCERWKMLCMYDAVSALISLLYAYQIIQLNSTMTP